MSSLSRRDLLKGMIGVSALGGCSTGAQKSKSLAVQSNAQPNLIRQENQRPGTRDWMLSNTRIDPKTKYRSPWIEGYCSRTSVGAGEKISFHVSTNPASPFTIDIYRLGYYGGAGGRHMTTLGPFRGTIQPDPPVGPKRLRECRWEPCASLAIPGEWPSGVYVGKLTAELEKLQSYVIFVVRDERPADFIFQCSDNTWQAYNRWPSQFSLYDDGKKQWYWGGGVDITFDRPYGKYCQILDAPLSTGSGEWFLWEFPLAYWLESHGYDVTYISNIDTHSDPKGLLRAKGLLSIGHDEYYSIEMFHNLQNAIRSGLNVAFLSGNACCGRINLRASFDGRVHRIFDRIDVFGPPDPADFKVLPDMAQFPHTSPNANTLIGARSVAPIMGGADWTCTAPDHWLFEGTGMKRGDGIPGLVGWEWHGDPGQLPGLQVVATGPTKNGGGGIGTYTATIYPGPKNNFVFNASSCWWADGLSEPPGYVRPSVYTTPRGPDKRAQQITANVLARMRSVVCSAILCALLALTGCRTTKTETQVKRLPYPKTEKVDHVDDYNGVKVADPFRWLEDDNAPATRDWVDSQNKVTFGYLEQIPERVQIRQRLTKLWNYERYGVPFKEGNRYFFTKNDGLQNQSVLYTMRSLSEQSRVLLDPNKLSSDGTVALTGYTISDDGQLMAYGLSTAGSDWEEWRVRDIESTRDLPDHIKWVKSSSASWTKDGKGFFYSRYDAPSSTNTYKGVNYYHKLYFHSLGATQEEDKLIYDRPDQKEWGFYGAVTDDGRYLVITAWHGTDTRNRVFYKDLQDENSKVVALLNDFDADYTFVDNIGQTFYFRTDYNAASGRLIAIDVSKPERANWREIVPETKDRLLGVNLVNDQFVLIYLHDAHSLVRFHKIDGTALRDFPLPGIGSVGGFGGKRTDHETFYSFTSFTVPGTIYRLDLDSGVQTLFRAPKVDFNPEDYETRQVFYHSKDGTRIPMFITHKKGIALSGNNPTLLYGYGGFDISLTPTFSVSSLVWMEMGGVFAEPNLRGGGEYGREWHLAGTKLKKQNVFDDFISAAEWLVANKYTNPKKLAIAGGSNGGLLVGACMIQRPDLFAAALPAVGVMDMLRFNKFTRGWAWTSDYGSPETPEEFKALYAYSPLHNLKPNVRYPATLVTTADHDDRVVPAHSFKFAARLQEVQAGAAPVLIRIETKAGHGAGKPTTKLIEESADKWAFLVHELGVQSKVNNEPRENKASSQRATK